MLVDVHTIAQALELSPRRVQQLARQGWIPREREGEYPLADCLTGYAAYLEEVQGQGGIGDAIDRARARKFRAQAELREVGMAVEAGELLEVDEVLDERADRLTTVRANLLSLPSVAGQLAGADQEEREEVLTEELEHAVAVLDGGTT